MPARSTTKRKTSKPELKRRPFFNAVKTQLARKLPEDLPDPTTRQSMTNLKVRWGANYRIHYEVMISSETGNVELGLHFEHDMKSTGRLLEHFDRYIHEIKDQLGQNCELERWTRSWGHIFEVHPMQPLTAEFAEVLAGRLALYIIVLQPMLEEAYESELVPRQPRPATGGRWRRRRG